MLHFAEKAELHINIKIKQTIGEIRVRNIEKEIIMYRINRSAYRTYVLSKPSQFYHP